jgi:hypothetical protein
MTGLAGRLTTTHCGLGRMVTKENVKQALLAACAVVAIGVSGCTRFDTDAEVRAIEAQTEREFAPIRAAQEEANKRAEFAEKLTEACILAFPNLKIGDSEATVRRLMPCKPSHVNTTETAHVYHQRRARGLATEAFRSLVVE